MQPRPYLPHLLRVKSKTAFGRRITPPFVTLYVTTRCDEKCIHCFYWDQLNPKTNRDFRLEEFEKTLGSMGEIYNLFIGGGEPFLRPDLGDIALLAARLNQTANLYTPTNGQHTERVVETLEQVLPAAPQMRFHLNLSVDHIDPDEYDRIRGREGAWRRMLRTAAAIEPLRARYPNLIVHTLTTVMRDNQAQILDIHEGLKETFRPDGTSYNWCRGDPLDPNQTDVAPEAYRQLRERLERDWADGVLAPAGPSEYSSTNHLLDQRIRETVEQTAIDEKAQFSCVSGRLAAVIYSDGKVVECEVKNSSLGNLRDVDYDFGKLWFSEKAKQVASAAANGCYCTHECGHYSSTIYSLKETAKIGFKAFTLRKGDRP